LFTLLGANHIPTITPQFRNHHSTPADEFAFHSDIRFASENVVLSSDRLVLQFGTRNNMKPRTEKKTESNLPKSRASYGTTRAVKTESETTVAAAAETERKSARTQKVVIAAASNVTPEQIAQRAFEIWEREGRPHGRSREHWFQAEQELNIKR
jgi:hypothetical protein